MDLFSVKTIKELLKRQETRPRKGLGQNFLTSKGVLGDILKAAQLKGSDTVLEIGPGIGTLTRELALAAKKVIAVEKDPAMIQILRETTKDLSNIEIIQGDILSFPKRDLGVPKSRLGKTYKVVANLPYYITSPVIRLFLDPVEVKLQQPNLMVLMVQKEVAQRICAQPPHMSLLAVSVQIYGKPSIVSYVKKNCFWPQPKVDSAILRIDTSISYDREILMLPEKQKLFFQVVKAGFKQPRKQLGNNLIHGLGLSRQKVETWLGQIDIQPTRRAETLTLQDWIKLAKSAII